jgi:Sigma-54 interaction domain/Sulfatase
MAIKRPNIVMIIGDDVGWFDVGAYHQGMMGTKTPNLDRIAPEGARLTDAYAQASCTAGRAAFITGQLPIRTGLTTVGLPGAPQGLHAEDPTLAELLKPLGYMTAQIGKNHLGDRNEFLPTLHGFDEFYGNLYHLNAEEEPEQPDYPKDHPAFKEFFLPRGVLVSRVSKDHALDNAKGSSRMPVPVVQSWPRQAEPAPECSCWREDSRHGGDFDEIIGGSASLREALALVRLVSDTDTTVFLNGETGTGKELVARAIHRRSSRRQRPLVRVNCAALPSTLIETELFGHDRGAFTGAVTTRQGRFELADKGTLFLDEIGDLSIDLQSRLLRVLEEGEFERVGSSQTRRVDVRVITAATHRNLEAAVEAGRFREDLYHRLTVFPIQLPPLRERRDDIPQLVWHFINERQRALQRNITEIPTTVMSALQDYASGQHSGAQERRRTRHDPVAWRIPHVA